MTSVKKPLTYFSTPLRVLFCLAALILLSQGCATVKPYTPPREAIEDQVQIPGIPDARAWGDEPSEVLKQSAIESLEQEKAANHGKLEPVVYALALSGGGQGTSAPVSFAAGARVAPGRNLR